MDADDAGADVADVADDVVVRPVHAGQLALVLDRARREQRLQSEVARLRQHAAQSFDQPGFVTMNPRLQAVFDLIPQVGTSLSPILIEGESGTGKKRLARAIHEAGRWDRDAEFAVVPCARASHGVVEGLLNRWAGGTGRGGTLVLDEVSSLSPTDQARLLNLLDELRGRELGATANDAGPRRVIALTCRRLSRLVRHEQFREDLFYRLNVLTLQLPPLRDRLEDFPLLVRQFAARWCQPGDVPKRVAPAALELLLGHAWPGNVRELEAVVERACVAAGGDELTPGDLLLRPPRPRRPEAAAGVNLDRPLPALVKEMTANLEERYLRRALRRCRGNIGACAQLCGLSRRSISTKLREYGIDKRNYRRQPATGS